MFDMIEFVINGHTVKGLSALALILAPFIACIFLGVMIGVQL